MSGNETIKAFSPTDKTEAHDPVYWLTMVFTYFLQNLFRDQFPSGSGMKWSPDEENSEIIITAEKPAITAIEKTPHIVCTVGSKRWSGIGLDQLQGMRISNAQRTHTDLIPGTITYHCQAREGLTAQRIAWNASLFTNIYRRVIIREGGFVNVGVQHEISPESAASAYTGQLVGDEIVSVQVMVPYYWQYQWKIVEPAYLFEKMRISLEAVASGIYSAGRSNLVRPPRIYGNEVNTVPLGQTVLVEE